MTHGICLMITVFSEGYSSWSRVVGCGGPTTANVISLCNRSDLKGTRLQFNASIFFYIGGSI